MVWNHSVATKTACVRTAHILHLNLKVCVARSGRVCGLATHAVGGNAGYGLLTISWKTLVCSRAFMPDLPLKFNRVLLIGSD